MNSKRYDGKLYEVRKVTDLKDIVIQSTELFPDQAAYLEKDKALGEFVPIKYSRVRKDLEALGTRLVDMGLSGKKIAVVGETSYHWILTYFTVVCGVGAIVPLDKNLPQDELMGLVERSGASALFFAEKSRKTIQPLFLDPKSIEYFVSLDAEEDEQIAPADVARDVTRDARKTARQEAKEAARAAKAEAREAKREAREAAKAARQEAKEAARAARQEAKEAGKIVKADAEVLARVAKTLAEEKDASRPEKILSMDRLISEGEKLLEAGNREYIDKDIDPDQMAALLFTSGTTGLAKGVMLSQRNIASNVMNMSRMFNIPEPGIVLSILPVHHAYEMTCDIWTTFYQGKTIAICEGLRYIQKNMAEVKANVMLGVPLVFEKFYKGMWKQAESSGQAEKLRSAIDLSRRMKLFGNKAVMKRMFKAVHQSFGGEMQKFVAGGAAIDPKVIEDFEAMGFNMIQGYGMTENSPIIAVNQDRYSKAASAGRPMPGTEVRIVDSDEEGVGEIICRGPSVMMGYYENQEATDEVLIDGWLHTGDLGYIDEEGFVYITGRKKTVIVTKGGKNIFPEELEAVLLEDEHIQEVVVHGVADDRVGNVMITADIYPNYALLKEENGEQNSSEIYHYFRELMEEINKGLPAYKQIKRVSIRTEEFEKTTTGKIKRYGIKHGSGEDTDTLTFEERNLRRAKETIKKIEEAKDPFVRHKPGRPITDIKQMLDTSVSAFGDKVAIWDKKVDSYRQITYRQLQSDVNALGTALLNRGLAGKHIGISGRNGYDWVISFLAVTCGVGVAVPLGAELDPEDLAAHIRGSDVEVIIADEEALDKIKGRETELGIKEVFSMDGELDDMEGEGRLTLETLIDRGNAKIGQGDRQFMDARIDPEDMATIVRTSGNTGDSKPVMLSHLGICDVLMKAPGICRMEPEDIFFSIQPLHYIYEIECTLLMALYGGASVAFARSDAEFGANIREVRPTIMICTASRLKRLADALWQSVQNRGRGRIFGGLMAANRITEKARINIVRPVAGDLRNSLGGRLRLMFVAGSGIDPTSVDFFNALGILTVQGYGLAEAGAIISVSPDTRKGVREGTAGHILPGVEYKIIARDEEGAGEILLRSDGMMLGYYGDEEGTAEVLRDGWLNTGDIGYVDDDGFMHIKGRRSEMERQPGGLYVLRGASDASAADSVSDQGSQVEAQKEEAGS